MKYIIIAALLFFIPVHAQLYHSQQLALQQINVSYGFLNKKGLQIKSLLKLLINIYRKHNKLALVSHLTRVHEQLKTTCQRLHAQGTTHPIPQHVAILGNYCNCLLTCIMEIDCTIKYIHSPPENIIECIRYMLDQLAIEKVNIRYIWAL